MENMFLNGYAELFYCGKLRDKITFWVRIDKKDYLFKVDNNLLNSNIKTFKTIRNQLIQVLNMDNLDHIRFKSWLKSL